MAAISSAGARMPTQARSALRVANAHSAAQAATRMASSMPVSTVWPRAPGRATAQNTLVIEASA